MRVELERVTAAYGDAVALRDISLTVPAGKAVALLGPNGAGKTTLLSTVSGQLRPVGGRILFDGVDVTAPRSNAGPSRASVTSPRGAASSRG
jgi:branched-chain amino acid transport system ATP-binding protein